MKIKTALPKRNQLIALLVGLIILATGLAFVLTRAAGYFVAVEVEKSTLSSNAKLVADASASGGQAIQFTAAASPTPPPPPPPPPSTGQTCPPPPAYPDANCTGVPTGVTLSAYTGSCTITSNNFVIDSKTVNCNLKIQATGVVVKNSYINGNVINAEGSNTSFTVTDSFINSTPNGPAGTAGVDGVGADNFTVLRTEVIGGNRGIYCRRNCTVQDSWVHGATIASTSPLHASGARASQGSTFLHNTLLCEAIPNASDGGCSADLTMYGDFEPVQNVHVENNLFKANNTGNGFCAYGGSSPGKPYSDQASNIVYINNVFEGGPNGKCGAYGPIFHFDINRPGNQWTNNKFDNGTIVPPFNS
jgi:hypothetical protein